MDKLRFPIALLLSAVVIFAWNALQPPRPLQEATPGQMDTSSLPSDPQGASGGSTTGSGAEFQPEALEGEVGAEERWQEWVELGEVGQPGHYHVRFDNRGASVSELRLGGYYVERGLDAENQALRDNLEPLILPVEDGRGGETRSFMLRTSTSSQGLVRQPLDRVLWKHELLETDGRVQGVHFYYAPGNGVVFHKTIRTVEDRYEEDRYELALELGVESSNPDHFGKPAQFVLTPAAVMPKASEDSFYVEPQAVSARTDGRDIDLDIKRRDDRASDLQGSFGGGSLVFAGVHNKYFALLLRGADEDSRAALAASNWRRVRDEETVREDPGKAQKAWRYMVTDLDVVLRVTEEGETGARRSFLVYAGPKERSIMAADFAAHAKLSEKDLGFFASIASGLLSILSFYHGILGNWGWAIIFLTLTVRLALFPLNRRSQTAMAKHQTKMKRVQPKLDEIKKLHAKDATKLRQEQARIMQEEGAFPPLGGCLPVFLQIPVFFGLFTALRTSFDMRQAPFMLWMKDLSAPDQLLRLDYQVPIIGTIEYLNILPILMVVLWILQQKVMPKPTDEQALRMQKMMMWMPIMFGFFLYNYAAGLSLYMITTSTFGILEQTVIKKIWPLDTTEKAKKKSGFMKRIMELSEQAQKMQEAQRQQGGKPGVRAGAKAGAKAARRKR